LALGIRARWRAAQAAHPDSLPVRPNVVTREILSVAGAWYATGRWFLTDASAHRVHVLDRGGRLIRSIGQRGAGPGEFGEPTSVAATANFIYVAERARPFVSVFDSSGAFLRHLRVGGSCSSGAVVALAAVGADLYVLRRCLELPHRIRHQLERSLNGGPLTVWNDKVDTISLTAGKGVPLQFVVMTASTDRLIVGEGNTGCLRVYELPDGRPAGSRCFTEIARRPLPRGEHDRLTQRWRGRVDVPDSLPRFIGVSLLDHTLALQSPSSSKTASWLELPWTRSAAPPRLLGRTDLESSFLGGGMQLIAHDAAEGVRIEIVPVGR
jgi:hypothetical protein